MTTTRRRWILALVLTLALPLGGGAETSGTPVDPGVSSTDSGELRTPLAEAASGLPRVRPSGRPVSDVVFLGISEDALWQARLVRALLPRRLEAERLHPDVITALAPWFDVREGWTPPEVASQAGALRAGHGGRDAIAAVNAALESEAVVVARVETVPGYPGDLRVRLRLFGGRTEPGAFEGETRVELPRGLETYGGWNPVAFGLYGALLLVAAFPLLRGSGALVVVVKESAAVRDAREREPSRTGRDQPKATSPVVTSILLRPRTLRGPAPPSSDPRFSRSRVGPKTRLEKLPPGGYVVEVRRVFRDVATDEVTRIQFEERPVTVRRGRATQLRCELASELIPVEIRVTRGGQAVADGNAIVGLDGDTGSVRYARGGATTLNLAHGGHTLLIGIDDRVFRRNVEIESATKRFTIAVDAASDEGTVFRDCRAAVVPYVQGDREGAISALGAAGQASAAHELQAELFRARGKPQAAAHSLERAGRHQEGAAHPTAGSPTAGGASSPRVEETGGLARDAEPQRPASDVQAAIRGDAEAAIRGDAEAGDLDGAIAMAFQSGDRAAAVELLARKGAFFDAARTALELGELVQATTLLQRISLHDASYGEACISLTQLFVQRGEPELALQKLDEAVSLYGSDAFLELREQIARGLEEKGDLGGAIEAYETIRKQDAAYPGVAEKIEALREAEGAAG